MKATDSKQEGLPVINSLRGVASFSVCLFHIICTTKGFIHTSWILSLFAYGKYGVQIFFVISGVVIPYSLLKSGYTLGYIHRFLIKRFIRLEPPYIAAILVALIYVYVREYIPGTASVDLKPTVRDLLLHVGYLVPFFDDARWLNDVFWTLAVEFQYYLVLALLFPLISHPQVVYRVMVYLAFFAGGFYFRDYRFFLFWAPLFLVGIAWCLYYFKKITMVELLLILAASAAYTIFIIDLTSFFLGFATLLIIIFFPFIKLRVLDYLGTISYSLYLIHCLSGVLFVNLASHYAKTYLEKAFVILGGILISIVCAHLLYVFVEKPSKRFSSKLKL